MNYLLAFIFFSGLVIAAVFALKSASQWPAKLMLFPSIIAFFCYAILAGTINNSNIGDFYLVIILSLLLLCCCVLYFIGLLFYCLKTHTATKANKELEYLNFQISDQLEIRQSGKNETPSPANIE